MNGWRNEYLNLHKMLDLLRKEINIMEIERKYLVKHTPEKLYNYKSKEITQYYINYDPEIRIRKEDDRKFLTIKSSGQLIRQEMNIEIGDNQFTQLEKMTICNSIDKTRFYIPEKLDVFKNELIYEIDVYQNIPGLIIVEVEFKTKEESDLFKHYKPDWFGEEITYIKEFKNKNLAKNGLPNKLMCFYCEGKGKIDVDDGYGMTPMQECEYCKGEGKLDIKEIKLENYNYYLETK